jgi:hypothetical protein
VGVPPGPTAFLWVAKGLLVVSKIKIACQPSQGQRWRALLLSWTLPLLPLPLLVFVIPVLFTINTTAAVVCLVVTPLLYCKFLWAVLAILRRPRLDCTLILSDRGIGIEEENEVQQHDWSEVRKVAQMTDAWLLSLVDRSAVLIPSKVANQDVVDLLVLKVGHLMGHKPTTSARYDQDLGDALEGPSSRRRRDFMEATRQRRNFPRRRTGGG